MDEKMFARGVQITHQTSDAFRNSAGDPGLCIEIRSRKVDSMANITMITPPSAKATHLKRRSFKHTLLSGASLAVLSIFSAPVTTALSLSLAALAASETGSLAQSVANCGVNPAGDYTASLECRPTTGDATLETQPGTTITIPSGSTYAIYATSQDGNNTSVVVDGTTITKNGTGFGILAMPTNGAASVTLFGTNSITLGPDADTAVLSGASQAMEPEKFAESGEILVTGALDIINYADNAGNRDGLEANSTEGFSRIVHEGTGTILVHGGNAILATATGSGSATAEIGSGVTLQVNNTNSGAAGFTNAGIRTISANGLNTVINAATIETTGLRAPGIYTSSDGSGAINIANSGTITTNGRASHGILAVSAAGTVEVANAMAAVTAGGELAAGILAIGATTDVTVGPNASISGGWQSDPTEIGTENSTPSAGILIGSHGGGATLINDGNIGAASDRAIASLDRYGIGAAGPLDIISNGMIDGFVELGAGVNTLDNSGIWNLRNFANTIGTFDADGNAVRDTLGVAISDFGTSGSNVVNNTGTIALLGAGDAAVTTLDTTGQYLPLAAGSVTNAIMGNSFNAIALGGPVQGQILGVQTFNNAGIIDLTANVVGGNAVVGDVLVISGGHAAGTDGSGVFVANGGTLKLDTVLNEGDANSQSDMLVVDSTQLGTAPTTIAVNNVSGAGALTTNNGIALVEVLNKSSSADGVFTLAGDYVTKDGQQAVVGGAYAYTLEHNGVGADATDGNWYLRSQIPGSGPESEPRYAASAPVYEAYPQILLGMNGLSSMQSRVGNRYWKEVPVPAEPVFCKDPAQNFRCAPTTEQNAAYADSNSGYTLNANGVWGRIEGIHNQVEPDVSTTGVKYNQNVLKLQAGIDGQLMENESGKLIGGAWVHYVHGSAKTNSIHDAINGGGEINTNGYGLGGSLTWYGENGFYLDAQGQVTWYKSDLDFDGGRRSLVGGNDGFGYALSIEGGKRITINPAWSLTPQAQLTWSSVTFDDFTDSFGIPVSLDRGDSLQGRMGLALNHETSWKNDDGMTDRVNVYGIANLYYEFLDGTRVDVADVSFANRKDRLWGGIGLGGSYNWNDDKYSIYGEGLVNTSLNNFADSYSLKGNIGFRVKW